MQASMRPARSDFGAMMRECGQLAQLALPLVFANLGGIAIATTDMLMLGHAGPKALAAVALALSIFQPLMLLCVGIGLAVTPLVTAARARHQTRQIRRVVRQGVWMALFQTMLCAPVFWFSGTIFSAIGQDADLAAHAQLYTRGVLPGLFFILLFNVLRSYLTALERTRAVLLLTLLAIPLNAVLNGILIFGAGPIPALGVLGAAIGSTLSNAAMAIGISVHCSRRRPFRRHALFSRFWRPDWSTFLELHRLGLPIGMMIVLEVAVFAGTAQLMGLIGTLELAAHQIAIQLASITFMVPLGVGQAATARVGIVDGRGERHRLARVGWAAMLLSTGFMGCTGLAFWLVPGLLVRPFLDGSDASSTVMALAGSYLAVAAAFQIVDGMQVTAAHVLRGLQDTRVPMWIAAFGYWGVAMPCAWFLGLHTSLQGRGIWFGLALGLAVCAILLARRLHRRLRVVS